MVWSAPERGGKDSIHTVMRRIDATVTLGKITKSPFK
jgi:hypothetical protein